MYLIFILLGSVLSLIVFVILFRIHFRKEIKNHNGWALPSIFYWIMIILIVIYNINKKN